MCNIKPVDFTNTNAEQCIIYNKELKPGNILLTQDPNLQKPKPSLWMIPLSLRSISSAQIAVTRRLATLSHLQKDNPTSKFSSFVPTPKDVEKSGCFLPRLNSKTLVLSKEIENDSVFASMLLSGKMLSFNKKSDLKVLTSLHNNY